MSRSTANLRKVMRSPLTVLESSIAGRKKRDPHTWVFASGIGFGEGTLPLARLAKHHGRHVVWLSDSPQVRVQAEAEGFTAIPKSTRAGWKATAKAGTIVVTHGLGDVHPGGRKGARVVQLWHGIPLKKLHRDAPAAYALPTFPFSKALGRMVQRYSEQAYAEIDTFVVASRESGTRLSSAFGLTHRQVAVTGDPRDDVLCAGVEEVRNRNARAKLSHLLDRELTGPVVLFAPTWREGRMDPTMPTARELESVNRQFKTMGVTLVIRPHHLAGKKYEAALEGKSSLVLLSQAMAADVTPLLPAFDALVSDYSSIVYDFSLLTRPTVFFAPDRDSYEQVPGLYENYDEFSGGVVVRTWADVVAEIYAILTQGITRELAMTHMENMAHRMHAFNDGRNTERVWEHLTSEQHASRRGEN